MLCSILKGGKLFTMVQGNANGVAPSASKTPRNFAADLPMVASCTRTADVCLCERKSVPRACKMPGPFQGLVTIVRSKETATTVHQIAFHLGDCCD